MSRSRLLAMFLGAAATGMPAVSFAQTTSEQMTCQQAVSTYERTGRINVRASGGTVIPVYKPAPVSQKRTVACHTLNTQRRPYNVTTSDKRRCTIGYYCR